ncbi:ribokinase [Pararobbsia alpina]|uniref:Ribokinase n=1 Tax=Pararobbsia alpina TaxID=621374 RepID=A0A6S7BBM9_9BURK|nr:ribokinase [Pararobbsia alpina]CAB3793952.1 Ribokinase [Pararobbsia alpina]
MIGTVVSDAPISEDDGTPARVCVVGNAAIDLTLRVTELPRAGETSLATSTALDFGGKGANQAVIAARAGAHVVLFAATGDDHDGDRIIAMLDAEHIDTSNVVRFACATDLSIVTVDARGENTIVTRNDAAGRYRPDTHAFDRATRRGDWVVLQGNLSAEVTEALLKHAHAHGRRTMFNPGPVGFDCRPLLPHVDVLVVNRIEAATLAQCADPEGASRSLREAGAHDVLVTLGANGVIWCGGDGIQHAQAPRTVAVDTVGAGDAFCGTLVAEIAHGVPIAQALPSAQSVAAFVVAHRGTQSSFPDRATLRELLSSQRTNG